VCIVSDLARVLCHPQLAAQRQDFSRKLAERARLTRHAEDPAGRGLSPAVPGWTGEASDAILQPPKPRIEPSARILERVPDRDLGLEAAG
jgi:hypothetical protein